MDASGTDRYFAGSIPEVYDRYLVPLIFQSYASDLARRLALLRPSRVLETAAGTGVVTRAMAQALLHAELVATDLNPPMLERARAVGAAAAVQWQPADAQSLPFDDASFDAVVCQFGAMFFPDKVAGYREAQRVLRRGQPFLFNVWDRLDKNDFANVVIETMAAMFPNDPPHFLERTPHGHHDADVIRRQLGEAGFVHIAIEPVAARSKAVSAYDAAFAYCQGTPQRGEIEARVGPADLQRVTERVGEALAARFGQGPIDGGIAALVVTARAP
jgi:ubiquinone/menaquinone biosynthesis C-methylase UbiE